MIAWGRWVTLWLCLGASLRLWILIAHGSDIPPIRAFDFLLGAANDLQAFAIVGGFVACIGVLVPRLLSPVLFVTAGLMIVVLFAEVFFWQEFQSRLNRLVFHYLSFPGEVALFLEEQFFISALLVPLALGSWGVMRFLLRRSAGVGQDGSPYLWAPALAAVLAFFLAEPFGQSASRLHSEWVSNGYLGVLRDARYDEAHIPWLAQFIGSKKKHGLEPTKASQKEPLLELRQAVAGKRHLVLIIEESFAGPVWRDPVLREKFLPNFSALSKASVSFSQLYATGSRTTRGMEAILNGFLPLPGISATQRAKANRLPSLARGMADGGFFPVFLYGGWPDFSNFHRYWRDMGFKRLWSRDDFEESFETSWGVSDEALFDRLLREMDLLTAEHPKVFLATLTVSHHRPFDFPEGVVPFPAEERRSEYALAYADHALGSFFKHAQARPWYGDTLFLVIADHGPKPVGDALVPAQSFRIPLLLLGEGIAAYEIDHVGSSMSLPKTLMNLFDIPTEEAFFGEDLLCDCPTVAPLENAYHIGLMSEHSLDVISREGRFERWRVDASTGSLSYEPQLDQRQGEGARRRVLEAFAPAYRRLYPAP